MSKISVSPVGGKLVLILEFPLSDKARYSQYKIHLLLIPQEIITNVTSYVMLVPRYSHLINVSKIFMCPPSLPFKIDKDNSPCEFALLARPTPGGASSVVPTNGCLRSSNRSKCVSDVTMNAKLN
ncbi:hypothetical protein TSAR_008433 [Trichomalopsis sarcophagae]|uniref:Uncharacterized protein n=1 Tax=Trichomalopsis sarcophagae TaxID=543379 RepID=A0A232EES3_9HYME|nr:hypothetical protein TSAR_008433 [Trichomalopsis sarcophagae]